MHSNAIFFTAIFDSKAHGDNVHKDKGWFYKGSGLFTVNWCPNFKPDATVCQFFPLWVTLPSLPLEYRDPELVQIIANQLRIFINHDFIPYELPHLEVRVCILVSQSKNLPTEILLKSKWGSWMQKIIVQEDNVVDKFQNILGHFATQCGSQQCDPVMFLEVCWDHISDANKCSSRLVTIPNESAPVQKALEELLTPMDPPD